MAARARRPLIALALLALLAAGGLLGGRALVRWLRPPEPLLPLGVLRVGIDPTMPPFAVLDTSGQVQGIEADLARELAAALGVPAQFVPLGYDGLYDALETDQVDVLLSGLTPNSAQTERVRYTIPYYNAGLLLVSPQAAAIADMRGLSGLRLAYGYGTSADTEAQRWQRRIEPFEPRPYETAALALEAVRLGEADAALADSTTVRLYAAAHPSCHSLTAEVSVLPYAAAVRSGRARLADALDRALQHLRDDGLLDGIIARGFTHPAAAESAHPSLQPHAL